MSVHTEHAEELYFDRNRNPIDQGLFYEKGFLKTEDMDVLEENYDIDIRDTSSDKDEPSARMRQVMREDSESDFLCSCCYELMVEPTTLVCGHNFCRLCLANWYLTSKKKECPTCRQVWQGHPKVNIALRNMMHKMLGNKIVTREMEIVSDFASQQKVRDFDKQMSLSQGQRNTDVGAFCTGICIALGVILIGYLVWYWRNSDQDLLIHKPAVRWKTTDVMAWLTDMDWAEEYIDIVHQRGIDGPVLLSLDEDSIDGVLNMTNPVHKRALLIAIQDVKDKGVKMPGSVWEYKAMYPGRCLFLLYGLKDFPRATLFYLYIFYYEDVFLPFLHFTTPAVDDDIFFNWSQIPPPTMKQWIIFLTNAILLPYWLVAKLTWSLFNRQYWTSFFVLFSCALLSIIEASLLKKYVAQAQWRFTLVNLKSYGKLLLTAFVTSLVWPIIPRFVCDFFFYANLYYTPIQQAKSLFAQWQQNML